MTIYNIYHCNEWKEYSSFRFIGSVEESELENTWRKIKKGTKYTNEEMETYIYVDKVELNELDI